MLVSFLNITLVLKQATENVMHEKLTYLLLWALVVQELPCHK